MTLRADERTENLTIAQTAQWLQFSEKKVRQLVKNGTIPAAQINHQWRIPRARLEAWLDEMVAGGGR